jgi:hypothetical protein
MKPAVSPPFRVQVVVLLAAARLLAERSKSLFVRVEIRFFCGVACCRRKACTAT